MNYLDTVLTSKRKDWSRIHYVYVYQVFVVTLPWRPDLVTPFLVYSVHFIKESLSRFYINDS